MDNQLLLLVLVVEFILLVSTAAPIGLSARFSKHPNFGILVWFGLFFASMAAAVLAVVLATSFVFESYFSLQAGSDIAQTLVISFAPWLLLAFGGVLLAIVNLRLAPYFESQDSSLDIGSLSGKTELLFQGVEVRVIPIPGYFALTKEHVIYLSKSALELDNPLRDAVLWHELGHVRLGHETLKRVANLALATMPWFLISRVFSFELARLCELAADNYALQHVKRSELNRARRLFL